jgi:hypothetical protein
MSARPLPLTHLVVALAGPIVWAAHFFTLYLAEAFACSAGAAPAAAVRWIGTTATIVALGSLAVWGTRKGVRASKSQSLRVDVPLAFAVPLTFLSTVAILWSAMPLFLLPACAAGLP